MTEIKKADHGQLAEAYNHSYYTIVGAGGDLQKWTNGYQELLDQQGIGRISQWYTFKGKDIDSVFGLEGDDAFKSSLTFLAFPLDGLDVGKLAIFKLRMEDRWFDDIIDNCRSSVLPKVCQRHYDWFSEEEA